MDETSIGVPCRVGDLPTRSETSPSGGAHGPPPGPLPLRPDPGPLLDSDDWNELPFPRPTRPRRPLPPSTVESPTPTLHPPPTSRQGMKVEYREGGPSSSTPIRGIRPRSHDAHSPRCHDAHSPRCLDAHSSRGVRKSEGLGVVEVVILPHRCQGRRAQPHSSGTQSVLFRGFANDSKNQKGTGRGR